MTERARKKVRKARVVYLFAMSSQQSVCHTLQVKRDQENEDDEDSRNNDCRIYLVEKGYVYIYI